MAKARTVCPLSREQFLGKAEPLTVKVGEKAAVTADVKDFSTRSLGWYANPKVTLEVDGRRVPCQVNISIVVIGSKEAD